VGSTTLTVIVAPVLAVNKRDETDRVGGNTLEEGKGTLVFGQSFVIDETPYTVWGADLHNDNLDCITRIDPRYFVYLGKIHAAALQTEDKQYAAVALRATYSQALETLFALLGAAIQAPQCVVGWLRLYKNAELYSLIRKIHTGQPIYTNLDMNLITWENIAKALLPLDLNGVPLAAEIPAAFGELWRRFAEEFLDPDMSEEYNSIKHGLRGGMGGFSASMGEQTSAGVPAENMVLLGSSEFGLHYYSTKPLGDKFNHTLVSKMYNWNPERFPPALDLIAASLINVLAFLQASNGLPAIKLRVMIPDVSDLGDFRKPWEQQHPSVHFLHYEAVLNPAEIPLHTKEDILAVYKHRPTANTTDLEDPPNNTQQ
jgi:hypothetical protein